MKVFAHSYGYVISCLRVRQSGDFTQWGINKSTDARDWLRTPLMLKGLCKTEHQITIMMHLVNRVNEMFISLANYPTINRKANEQYEFPDLYHIDCRLIAGGFDGWFDEIHLKSDRYKIIAEAYKHVTFETQIPHKDKFRKERKVLEAVWFDTK